MAVSDRAGSPLACSGPRTSVHVSRAGAQTAELVAKEFGLTQRIVLDAALEDAPLLRRVATHAARRVQKRRQQAARSINRQIARNGRPSEKTTRQDAPGRTRKAWAGV